MLSNLVPSLVPPDVQKTPTKNFPREDKETPSINSSVADISNNSTGLDYSRYGDDDAVSEAPSYSQKLGNLRIHSDLEQEDSQMLVLDSQTEQEPVLSEQSTTEHAHGISAPAFESLKRKAPRSAFSSDSSVCPKRSATPSEQSCPSSRSPTTALTSVESQQTNRSISKQSAQSPSPSSSSLSSVSDLDEPNKPTLTSGTPSSPTPSSSDGGRHVFIGSARGKKMQGYPAPIQPDRQPRRKSLRSGYTSQVPSYAESDDDIPARTGTGAKAKPKRARKQRKLSMQT